MCSTTTARIDLRFTNFDLRVTKKGDESEPFASLLKLRKASPGTEVKLKFIYLTKAGPGPEEKEKFPYLTKASPGPESTTSFTSTPSSECAVKSGCLDYLEISFAMDKAYIFNTSVGAVFKFIYV
jgi:hypothetical protein